MADFQREGEGRRFWLMDEGGETAVVRCGRDGDPYWWVICPQTTTLMLEPPEVTDEVNCSNVCEFEEEHAWADAVIRAFVGEAQARQEPPASEPEGDLCVRSLRWPWGVCGMSARHPVHDKAQGFPDYHPFRSEEG